MPVFLFTDIEGSTTKWEKHPDEMKKRLPIHDIIIMKSLEKHGGVLVKHTGDGFFAVFDGGEPLACALEIQDKMQHTDWGKLGDVRVRIGLHAGSAEKKDDDYFGPAVNRASRIMSTAWGGQIVFTKSVKNISDIPSDVEIIDHGLHMLKDLGEPVQVFGIIHPELPLKEFPPLRSLSSHHHNLPAQSTSFIGRDKELSEIKKMICNDHRLITLNGPGGIGKTRLAIQVAADIFENFKHGVFFIPLDRLDSVDFILSSIAENLKLFFHGSEDERTQLFNYLREKEILFVYDNFEHVIEGAPLVSDILREAANVKVLITSREVLNLKGEHVYKVNGLELPHKKYEEVEGSSAVQLFLQSAKRVKPDVEFSETDKQCIVDICQLLEGQPLGIELAAAWIKTISPIEILTEIQANIDFLSTSLRDVPVRQRSMRAVFDYSWSLLTDQEKDSLMKLSVFRGGFQRDAAKEVAGITLSMLSGFVDQSLLRVNSIGRYDMLYIVRQYADEKFEKECEKKEKVRADHELYYINFLEEEDKKANKEPVQVLNTIAFEIENIRKAWDWAVEKKEDEVIERAAKALHRFYKRRGLLIEGKILFRKATGYLEGGIKNSLYARLLRYYAIFSMSIGDYREAKEQLEHSMIILENLNLKDEIAATLNQMGEVERFLGNIQLAEKYINESLELFKTKKNTEDIAQTLSYLAYVIECKGDNRKALEIAQESLKLWEKIGDPYGISKIHNVIGGNYHGLGEYDRAVEHYIKGLEITEKLGDREIIATIYNNLAIVYALREEVDKATDYFNKAIEIRRDLGDRRGVAGALSNLGVNAHNKCDFKLSIKCQEEALAINREIGYQAGITSSLSNLAETLISQEEYEKALSIQEEGTKIARAVGDSWLVERALLNLGNIYRSLKNFKKSRKSFQEALDMAYQNEHKPMVSVLLISIGRLLLQLEEKEKALQILYFLQHYSVTPELMMVDIQPAVEDAESALSQSQRAAILKKAKNQKIDSVVKRILEELKT